MKGTYFSAVGDSVPDRFEAILSVAPIPCGDDLEYKEYDDSEGLDDLFVLRNADGDFSVSPE